MLIVYERCPTCKQIDKFFPKHVESPITGIGYQEKECWPCEGRRLGRVHGHDTNNLSEPALPVKCGKCGAQPDVEISEVDGKIMLYCPNCNPGEEALNEETLRALREVDAMSLMPPVQPVLGVSGTEKGPGVTGRIFHTVEEFTAYIDSED